MCSYPAGKQVLKFAAYQHHPGSLVRMHTNVPKIVDILRNTKFKISPLPANSDGCGSCFEKQQYSRRYTRYSQMCSFT